MNNYDSFVVPIQSRGQINIPLKVRQEWRTNRVILKVAKNGDVVITPMRRTLEDALGSYKLPEGKSFDEFMDDVEQAEVDDILNAGH